MNIISNLNPIIKGVVGAIISTLILLLLFSAILTYTNLSENITPLVIIAITLFSIFIATSISTIKVKKNGILNGGIIAIIYIGIIYLISSLINQNFSLNMYSIIMILGSMICGMVGGVIGVNKN